MIKTPGQPVRLIDFGLMDYQSVWELQQRLVTQRLENRCPDTLLIGEHPHVITKGRGSHDENLLMEDQGISDIPVVEIERGGDVTYHGPGQLIAYPILFMPPDQRDLHRYLRMLEEAIIQAIATFSLVGERNAGWTGVWVPEPGEPANLKKLASIGVAVKKWVTYHGIALNVSTDLDYFRTINPCGLESQVMTSMAQLLDPKAVDMSVVKTRFCQAFEREFERKLFTENLSDFADMLSL